MRSKSCGIVTDKQVQALAQSWLADKLKMKDAGWKCTAETVWRVLLLAAARVISIYAACRDLADAPSDDAIRNALAAWLPRRILTLERWFEPVLAGDWLPRRFFRQARTVAIDWHMIPYHGEPQRHANELRHGPRKSGTTKSHGYATACIVDRGFRYTLAVTAVSNKDSIVNTLERLLNRLQGLQACGLQIKVLLLDRQFCTSPVMSCLQARKIPFLMPLKVHGRAPKHKRRKRCRKNSKRSKRRTRSTRCTAPQPSTVQNLRDFRRCQAGRYRFTWSPRSPRSRRPVATVTFDVVVAYRSYHHHQTGRRQSQKLLYVAWHVPGSPQELRELYRRRFGIEASYRQLGEARIRTSTRNPIERLLFVLLALLLRNLWAWLHWTYFTEFNGPDFTIHLECLRFGRMLNWIAQVITQQLHHGGTYSTQLLLQ